MKIFFAFMLMTGTMLAQARPSLVLWMPDTAKYGQMGSISHVDVPRPATTFRLGNREVIVVEDELACSLDNDLYCVIAWNWRLVRHHAGVYGAVEGTFLYRAVNEKKHPGEVGIFVDYAKKQASYYWGGCSLRRHQDCGAAAAAQQAAQLDFARMSEAIAAKAESARVDCLRSLQVGMAREDVLRCGSPLHENADLVSGAQLVYPGEIFVYLDKQDHVENVQWTQ